MAVKIQSNKYKSFSRFYSCNLHIDDKIWRPEHYFQAQKFFDKDLQERVRLAKWVGESAQIGRDKKLPLRDDWEIVKIDVMRKVVRAKIEQHDHIKELLLSTANEEIIENSPVDYFWGCGKTGTGQNWLGKIWMEMRDELRQQNDSKNPPNVT